MRRCRPQDLPTPPHVQAAVADFVARLREEAVQAGEVIVFGSAARGEYGPESDVDVWVDWEGPERDAADLLARLSVDVLGRHDVLVTAFAFDADHRKLMQEASTRFYRTVHEEGLAVA